MWWGLGVVVLGLLLVVVVVVVVVASWLPPNGPSFSRFDFGQTPRFALRHHADVPRFFSVSPGDLSISHSSGCFPCKKEKRWKFWKFTSQPRSIVIGFVKWYFEILV
ncbi:predicted protein [Histoplasma mississippiense (nom. inval.)]|uniref:predicted protein n=1 Tax=Ajellomyces capsulatus (strain NAm1 / WU24) TaxID=2059318 RepID=UPI000157CF51|nr:predicted protein [Histoplasma mississippiense (nom. inval.)]EDN11176.1 predicted protein [Histoplasma mississippiense (nom. inval.)]